MIAPAAGADDVDPESVPLIAHERRAERPRRVHRRAAERDRSRSGSRSASAGSRSERCRRTCRSSSSAGSPGRRSRVNVISRNSAGPYPTVGHVAVGLDEVVVERDQQQERRQDRSGELEDPVPEQVLERQSPVEEEPERDGRIEVPAGDLARTCRAPPTATGRTPNGTINSTAFKPVPVPYGKACTTFSAAMIAVDPPKTRTNVPNSSARYRCHCFTRGLPP